MTKAKQGGGLPLLHMMAPSDFQARLAKASGRRVLVMFTDNTSTMVSFRTEEDVVVLRAHRMFRQAPPEVIRALADWILGRRRKGDAVQEFIDANRDQVRAAPRQRRRVVLRTEGRHHDLGELHAHLNATYLDGRAKAPITWGREVNRRAVRSVRLGWYDPARNLISLSRRLDRADIPRYMVEYVLYHEMLHEVLGIGERPDGKRDIHGRTFRLMEQTYPHYAKARAFERRKWG